MLMMSQYQKLARVNLLYLRMVCYLDDMFTCNIQMNYNTELLASGCGEQKQSLYIVVKFIFISCQFIVSQRLKITVVSVLVTAF